MSVMNVKHSANLFAIRSFMKDGESPSVNRFCTMLNRLLNVQLLLMLCVGLVSESVWADRDVTLRYSLNTTGDIAWIGNVNLTCPAGTACTNALNGTDAGGRNDNFNMMNLDLDGVAGTANSSAAILNIPVGATVEYARLYWSARRSTNATSRTQVKFRPAGVGSYSTITADTTDVNTILDSTNYQSTADVTSQVRAAGSGTYWVADIHATTGGTVDYAAWALVVVYTDTAQPFRNLSLFDGLKGVHNSSTNFDVTGFLTPFNGPVVSRLGVLGYEGDRPTAADYVRVNGTNMSNGANPATNFFNATISNFGVKVTNSTPSYDNNLQFDLDVLNIPQGIVGNGATSANIAIGSSSTNEAFALAAVSFSTDIYVPTIIPNVVKTAEDVNGGTLLRGETLRWNVVMSNTGYDSATKLTAIDNIPAYLTYVPGSLRILTGANSGTKTDSQYDDQAEFLTGPNRVVFRLGTGANATQGGVLAYGQSTSFSFDTTVNSDTPAGYQINNEVQISYEGQTIPGTTFAGSSSTATATIVGTPIITKNFSPSVIDTNQTAVLTITLANPASNPVTLNGVSFSDTYPAGLVNTNNANPQVTCTPGSTAGTITGGINNGNTIGMNPGATIVANGVCIITVNVTSASAGSYANTTSTVTSSNGGTGLVASATLYVGKPRITKAFSPASINAGSPSTITFTLQNPSGVALTQVAFSDTLTNMQVAASPGITNTCSGTVAAAPASTSITLANGAISANSNCTITVNVTSSTAGTWPNTTTGVSSLQSGAAGQSSNTAQLEVIGPPVVSKSFFPLSVRTNGNATLTLVLTNPNTSTPLTGVGITDNYPSNLRNSTPANGQVSCTAGSTGGTLTATNNGTSVSLSGASLAAGGSCTITVNVSSATAATYNNITNAVASNIGAGNTASATLIVADRLSATKAFAPTSIAFNNPVAPVYTSSTMTITVTATAGAQVTGINFVDTFPAGLMVANAPAASTSCASGTLQGRTGSGAWGSVASGNTAIRLTGANLNGSANCTVTVAVTANSTALYTNTTDMIYSNNGGTVNPVSAALNVLGPPQITKSFDPTVIALRSGNGNYSTLTITISNPTTATVGLTGVSFEDIFPAGVAARTGSNTNRGISNTCGGTFTGSADGGGTWRSPASINASDNAVRLTSGSLAAGATCTLTINVQGTTEGQKINNITSVSATNGGTGSGATASLWVGSPTVAKNFTCTQPIVAGTVCQYMTLAITAPSTALAAPVITDIFPLETLTGGSFTLYDTTWNTQGTCPSGGGAFTVQGRTGSGGSWGAIAAGNTAIRATATGSIAANNTCTLRFRVTSHTNSTNIIPAGALTGTVGGNATSNAVSAQATLLVLEPPTLEKAFGVPSVLVSDSTTMTIQLSQVNSSDATGVAFTDTFPGETASGVGSPLRLTNGTVTNTCNGTLQGRNGSSGAWAAPATGHTALRLSGAATIPAASDCTIIVNVSGFTAGSYTNTISEVTTTNMGSSNSYSATLVVMAPPTVAKAFTPSTVQVGDPSLLTITLTNPNQTAVVTGAAFTDTYPANVVNYTLPNASSSCGGTVTAAPNGTSLALSGGVIPANGSCSVSVRVTSSTANVTGYTNTLAAGALTSSNAGSNAAAASAVLIVNPLYPQLSLIKQVSVFSDPYNNLTNPKAIPGATMTYVVRVTNTGPGVVDTGTMKISDHLPTEVDLYTGTGAPATPLLGFTYTDGTPASGLTACTFGNKNDNADCVEFSTDGSTWVYVPTPDANGFDPAIRYIRFVPQGPFNAAGSGNPWAEFSFKVRVK